MIEVFGSFNKPFWITVGKISKSKGYKDGRIFVGNELQPGIGGGLCNLGNTIHNLVLRSPLDVVELHTHSDALAPEQGKRVPFANGTAISYNMLDYRFKNNTDQMVQILLWIEDETLFAELRSERPFRYEYDLLEENHRFEKEKNGKYYRKSKIYKVTKDRKKNKAFKKELVLDNRSEVMYDYDLIPKELIK